MQGATGSPTRHATFQHDGKTIAIPIHPLAENTKVRPESGERRVNDRKGFAARVNGFANFFKLENLNLVGTPPSRPIGKRNVVRTQPVTSQQPGTGELHRAPAQSTSRVSNASLSGILNVFSIRSLSLTAQNPVTAMTVGAGTGETEAAVHLHLGESKSATRAQRRDEFDEISSAQNQDALAKQLGLPTSFQGIRDDKSAGGSRSEGSKLPELGRDFYDTASPAQLDAFLQFSLKEHSAENLYFMMAAEKLLQTPDGDQAKAELATRMQQAFVASNSPLGINLDSTNQKTVNAALTAVARGNTPANLPEIIKKATDELFRSMGSDSYTRFRARQPA